MPTLHEIDIEQAEKETTIAVRQLERTGECYRCGLCCLISQASRTVKNGWNDAEAVLGSRLADGARMTPSDARHHKERNGFLMALETSGYWFWLRWDPCPHLDMGLSEADHTMLTRYLRLAHDEDMVVDWGQVMSILEPVVEFKCRKYEDRPTVCRTYPVNNTCIWLITKEWCGYTFPKPTNPHLQLPEDEPEGVPQEWTCAACGADFVAVLPPGKRAVQCTACKGFVLVE